MKNPTPEQKPAKKDTAEACASGSRYRGDFTAGQKADERHINKAVKTIAGRKFK